MKISEKSRQMLKSPLGEVTTDFKKIKELSKDHRIISVGDICTLSLLSFQIEPHLAVIDFKSKRTGIDGGLSGILKSRYPDPKRIRNESGTISDEILANAGTLLEEGGAIVIDGEEDLTALAFIMAAKEKDLIVYGQPDSGIVIVFPDRKTKEKVTLLLSS